MRKKSKKYNTICIAVKNNSINEPFTVTDVNKYCDNLLMKSPAFLSKHADSNPGNYTEYFIRVEKGKYMIKAQHKC